MSQEKHNEFRAGGGHPEGKVRAGMKDQQDRNHAEEEEAKAQEAHLQEVQDFGLCICKGLIPCSNRKHAAGHEREEQKLCFLIIGLATSGDTTDSPIASRSQARQVPAGALDTPKKWAPEDPPYVWTLRIPSGPAPASKLLKKLIETKTGA